MKMIILFFLMSCAHQNNKISPSSLSLKDEYEGLLQSDSESTKNWIKKQNEASKQAWGRGEIYTNLKEQIFHFQNSQIKFHQEDIKGDFFYQIHLTSSNPLGVWRRIKLKDYLQKKQKWENLLDLDILSKEYGLPLNLQTSSCLAPEYQRCLLTFSVNSTDQEILKEFDLQHRTLLPQGFQIHNPSRLKVQWIDKDQILLLSSELDHFETKSSYPHQARLWKRGSDYQHSSLIFEGKKNSTGVFLPFTNELPKYPFVFADYLEFREKIYTFITSDQAIYTLASLPKDAQILGLVDNSFLIKFDQAFSINKFFFPAQSLALLPLEAAKTNDLSQLKSLFILGPGEFFKQAHLSKDYLWIELLSNVATKILRLKVHKNKVYTSIVKIPSHSTVYLDSVKADSNTFFMYVESFQTPLTQYFVNESSKIKLKLDQREKKFDSSHIQTEYLWSQSKDGTPVPYFVMKRKDLPQNKPHPTLIWGYGAGGDINSPWYMGNMGKIWVDEGGILVSAVLRGGGEFGVPWKLAGQKSYKQKTFDDLIGISEDLVRRGYSQKKKIGLYGSSWGGLLVSACMVQRPDLFGAILAMVPMEDMLHFPLLPIGEIWMGEFGDPKIPSDREVLARYSPYHNVKPNEAYPPLMITTTTNDDRMHPGHARRMAAKMLDQGHEVYFTENAFGGHTENFDPTTTSTIWAMRYHFLKSKLGLLK